MTEKELITELYKIWASIPPTFGKTAREQIKGLIDKLEGKEEEWSPLP